jgi:uncharacterized Zn finger protein
MIKCKKCGQSFEPRKDAPRIIVSRDMYIQVSEYLQECPNCGHIEEEQVLEESTLKLKKSAV